MPVPPLVQILNPRVVLDISKGRNLFLFGVTTILARYYSDVLVYKTT